MGGVGGGGGVVLESSGSNNHPLRFLSYFGRCGGVGQGGGREGEIGGDQTSGKGAGDGGEHQQCGVHWFHLLGSLKNQTIDLIWEMGGGAPESSVGATRAGGPGRRARGRWGGGIREQSPFGLP